MRAGPSRPAVRRGLKPLQAAIVKSDGGERCSKRWDKIPSGVIRRGERKRTADEVSKCQRRCQNRGVVQSPGISPGAVLEDCPSDIRHVGGAKPDQALVWNVRTCRPDAKGDVRAARTARIRVPMRGTGAERLVESGRFCNGAGSRGAALFSCDPEPTGNGRSSVAKAKPFNIPKREVWEAFKKVKANQGAAGVDSQTIAEFEADLSNNLYPLWYRMSSGSYFPPPVRRVDLPKSDRLTQPLCIPTVCYKSHSKSSNCIWSPSCSPSSTITPMYTAPADLRSTPSRRPDSVAGCSTGCSILMSRAILTASIVSCCSRRSPPYRLPMALLYIERWLKAPVEMKDGSVVPRTAETPQSVVVSPVLANLFLHYAFDTWMARSFPSIPFERYADDIICHCRIKKKPAGSGMLWRSASGPADWFSILRRRSSSIARIRTGAATFRSSRLIFSATPFVRDKRFRTVVVTALPSCQRQSEGAEGNSADDPTVGVAPSDRQIPGRFGADVSTVHPKLDQLLQSLLQVGIDTDLAAY